MSTAGYAVLFVSLELCVFSSAASFLGARLGYPRLVASARACVFLACGLLSAAVALLLYAFYSHDFSLSYVADYSSSQTSPLYLLTSFYAGNEGSLLLWAWMLSVFSVLVTVRSRSANRELLPLAASVLMAIAVFFLVLLVFVANPFSEAQTIVADGRGLNPLLENPGMLLHPPVILAGYAAFAVPFAFAVAALATRRADRQWLATTRNWVLVSWLLLGMGNLIGAWWAYTELGWGGYWAWDPVENAGLMPWLMSTAVLHAIAMLRTRGTFRAWTVFLIILTFDLTIFGTYLARSNYLTSVHNFGLSELDPYFLVFLGMAVLGPLALMALRRADLKGAGAEGAVISRDGAFLLADLLLVFATLVVFLGTLLGWSATFFNYWVGVTLLAVVMLMGMCALISRRRERAGRLGLRLLPPLLVAAVAALALSLLSDLAWNSTLLFSVCAFVLGMIGVDLWRSIGARGRSGAGNPLPSFWSRVRANRPRYGGLLVHLGILLICVGVVGSSFNSVEAAAALRPGESLIIDKYRLDYEGISTSVTESRIIVSAPLLAYCDDKPIGEVTPQRQYDIGYQQSVSEVAVRYGLWEDLYVVMASWDSDETAVFQVRVNRLVTWLWMGGALLLLGSLWALSPAFRRGRGSVPSEPPAGEAGNP